MPRALAVSRTHQTQQPLPPTADQASSETETCFSPATMHAAEGREEEPGNPASARRRCTPRRGVRWGYRPLVGESPSKPSTGSRFPLSPVLLASPLGKSDLGDDLRPFAGVFLGAHRAGFVQRLQVLQPLTN